MNPTLLFALYGSAFIALLFIVGLFLFICAYAILLFGLPDKGEGEIEPEIDFVDFANHDYPVIVPPPAPSQYSDMDEVFYGASNQPVRRISERAKVDTLSPGINSPLEIIS